MRRPSFVACLRLATAVVLLWGPRPIQAQTPEVERAEVLAVVQSFFDAMAHRDTTTARALLMPGARLTAILGDGNRSAPRVQGDTAFVRNLTAGKDRLLERMWEPVVHLRGPLATVWGPYDFHVNGRRTHCGVDTFTLLRTAGVWRVSAVSYTVELTDCTDSPLGPPK